VSVTVKGVNFYGPCSEYVVSGSDCGNVFLWHKKSSSIVNYFHADDGGVVSSSSELLDGSLYQTILFLKPALLCTVLYLARNIIPVIAASQYNLGLHLISAPANPTSLFLVVEQSLAVVPSQ